MKLVSITDYVPDIIIDLRYAGPHNITGAPLYAPGTQAQVDTSVVVVLRLAMQMLKSQGYRLVIWDAYRSKAVQAKLRTVMTDVRYVAQESNHPKGLAVDVTLAEIDGTYLDMGTDHDEFTPVAYASASDLTHSQQRNRRLLATAMKAAGFTQWPYEWWHFDYLGK